MPSYTKQAEDEPPYNQEADDYSYDEDEGDQGDDIVSADSSDSGELKSTQTPRLSYTPTTEKQISVDPMSLKQLSSPPPPLALPTLVKPKFISTSLPCSAASSPHKGSSLPKSFQRWSTSITPAAQPLSWSRKKGMYLGRSKSCRGGRPSAPSDEFDILPRQSFHDRQEKEVRSVQITYEDVGCPMEKKELEEAAYEDEKRFKCGALCLFLPGLSKKKNQNLPINVLTRAASLDKVGGAISRVVSLGRLSNVASLEKFECGSWSGTVLLDEDEDGGVPSYFDLPMELMRSSTIDADSPVKTAFVFERDRKGVLKKSGSRLAPSRRSHESSGRHVRFSTSNPTSNPSSPMSPCITPRLWKAREDFNALLEAQGA